MSALVGSAAMAAGRSRQFWFSIRRLLKQTVLEQKIPPTTLTRKFEDTQCQKIVDADVCPALVGLIGPATSGDPGKYCGAWPLLLPLAPYAEAVMSQEADHAD